jgi:glucose-6-phosphate 1-dehydrogenase
MKSVLMEFHYSNTFGTSTIPEAYERLLLDVLNGDASLFNRDDNVEIAWQLIDPIQDAWNHPNAPSIGHYEPNTWGPREADDLLAANGFYWLPGCSSHSDL